ncbi:predicted protein [Nematostella vectensis]|uniref:Uncharacterized protein n=1 Tax=Nematostella vectensis TaxID=45351 RepID=A7S7Y9_NEMVE|nr:probable diacyglycerol O-acyltransferase tgs1 [Nematostella vectensis]EDO40204.1 predicted protein [Nematostella vectensis]|eukprot:XP_001632267.1 predicted protein [Nematostella vectensis]
MGRSAVSEGAEILQRKTGKRHAEINDNKDVTASKEIPEMNHPASKGVVASKRLPTRKGIPSKFQKFMFVLSNIRFIIECLICNALVLMIAPYVFPVIMVYFILKKIEQYVEHWRYRATPVGGEDALWLQDSETNRLIITSIVFVNRPGDMKTAMSEFREVVRTRLVDSRNSKGELSFPRARKMVRPGYFQYFFQDDPDFDIEDHVFKYQGDPPKSKQELEAIVSEMYSKPFPEGKSPWYFCCVPTDYGDKSVAAIFRMHHCMADGVSLSRLLTRVLPDHYTPQKEARKFSSSERGLMTAKGFFIMTRTVIALLMSFADRSIVHGKDLKGKKKCVWSEPFDLNIVKQIKSKTGTTVNDVLMACLSLAIRRYFQKRGINNPEDFTSSIPVDVGKPTKETVFQNKFAVVFMKLPVSHNGILETLFETKRRMDVLKMSGEPIAMAYSMAMSTEFLPEFLVKPLASFIASKASCVLSNVPGPQYHMSVSGNPVQALTFWPPQRSNIGIGLSIFSYAGQVVVGADGDHEIMSDPELVTVLFGEVLQEMALHVLGTKIQQPVY